MQEESSKVTISFHYVDTFRNTFDSSTTAEVFYSLGDSELDLIGRQLNIFLKQCGYFRDKDQIFMEAIDEDEYDAITSFLAEYRKGKEPHAD